MALTLSFLSLSPVASMIDSAFLPLPLHVITALVVLFFGGLFWLCRPQPPLLPVLGPDPTVGEDEKEYDADVIIVGGGVAGSSLASCLGRNGRKVVVLERDFEVNKVRNLV